MSGRAFLILTMCAAVHASSNGADAVPQAINELGLDLLRAQIATSRPAANVLLSPYSISSALAMAHAGADGTTREELRAVLHLPAEETSIGLGFSGLALELGNLQEASRRRLEQERKYGGDGSPVEIDVANRLFAQRGYRIRPAFAETLSDRFAAPLEELDFRTAPEPARQRINGWVAEKTHDRIRDLVPAGAINADTRVVLANALYLRAPWASAFREANTRDEPFWVGVANAVDVPTMHRQDSLGYEQRVGYSVVTLPYAGGDLQFVVLLPDARDGLAAVESSLVPADLMSCRKMPARDVVLRLPKFKLEPPSLALGELLQGLGLKTAFDRPPGSANFDRMAPRQPDDYLAISEVIHKTWLALDEKGTEAAAATAVLMMVGSAAPRPKPPPLEVRVDHPFLFAIQHVPSGTCLFLGRVVDPRK